MSHTDEGTNGCDSTTVLHLFVSDSVMVHIRDTVCRNNNYEGYGFNVNSSQTAVPGDLAPMSHTDEGTNGCDSTTVLHLHVNEYITNTVDSTVCANDLPIFWNGVEFIDNGESVMDSTVTIPTLSGTDSVLTMHVHINPVISIDVFGDVCAGSTFDSLGFQLSPTADTLVSDTTASLVTLCDSITTLHLTVLQPTSSVETITACDSAVWHGVTYYASTNTPTFDTINVTGCDSSVTLNLTVNQSYDLNETDTICSGELPYTWRDTTFQAGTTSGVFVFNKSAVTGCDSSVTLTLTVNQSYNLNEAESICSSELPFTWRDTTFQTGTTSGVFVFQRTAACDCDSTVTLNLTVNNPTHTSTTDFACEPYVWNGQTYTGSTTDTFGHFDANGCWQVDTLYLSFIDTAISIVCHTRNFCEEGRAVLEVQTTIDNYVWDNGATDQTITVYDEGTYSVTATQGGCTVEAQYIIPPCEYDLVLPNAFSPDGDGLNDEFGIPEALFDQINDDLFSIHVYNRWGTLVFTSYDKHFRWNGEVNGTVYHNNIYNYVIKYRTSSGFPKQLSGSVITL